MYRISEERIMASGVIQHTRRHHPSNCCASHQQTAKHDNKVSYWVTLFTKHDVTLYKQTRLAQIKSDSIIDRDGGGVLLDAKVA